MNYHIKIVTGFRQDQEHTIPAEEAHKAYYLFYNPDKRAVFNNGLALRGEDVKAILPDYHTTMGWHKTHKLGTYDYAELEEKRVDRKIREFLAQGKDVALHEPKEKLSLPLSQVRPALA